MSVVRPQPSSLHGSAADESLGTGTNPDIFFGNQVPTLSTFDDAGLALDLFPDCSVGKYATIADASGAL